MRPFFDSTGAIIEESTPVMIHVHTKQKDPQSADVAVPRALKTLENQIGASRIAKESGFSVNQLKTAWAMLAAFALLTFSSLAGDIQRGADFVDGTRLSASKLQSLVDSATILPSFYKDKTPETLVLDSDTFLVLDSGLNWRKVTALNLLLNNTNLFAGRLEQTNNFGTNAVLLVYDPSFGVVAKVNITNITRFGLSQFVTRTTNIPPSEFLLTYNPDNTNGDFAKTTISNFLYAISQTNSLTNLFFVPEQTQTTNQIAPSAYFLDCDPSNANNTNGGLLKISAANLGKSLTALNPVLIGQYQNLVIQNGAGTNQMTLTADRIILPSTNGLFFSAGSVTTTVTLLGLSDGTNGVGVLESGNVTNNTWYYIYAISDGTNVSSILSYSPDGLTSQAIVTNYPFSARMGAAFNTTNNFKLSYQKGSQVATVATSISAQVVQPSSLSLFSSSDLTSLKKLIPPIATAASGWVAGSLVGGTYLYTEVSSTTNGIGRSEIADFGAGMDNPFQVILSTPQNFARKSGGDSQSDSTYCYVISGYSL
jgi:hypothetical protein